MELLLWRKFYWNWSELPLQPPTSRLTRLWFPISYHFRLLRAVSSVVEHYLDTVGVTGSNPVSRTIIKASRICAEMLCTADKLGLEQTVYPIILTGD
jgi:hypothetical protein